MKSLTAVIVSALFIAACSSGGGSDNKAPAGQVNSKLTGNAPRALTGQTAIFEASHSLAKSRDKQINQVPAKFLEKTSAQVRPETAAVKEKSNRVNRAIQNGACKIAIDQNQNSSGRTGGIAAEFSPVKMKIAGGGCPIEISLDMSMAGMDGKSPCQENGSSMSCKFNANVKMTYQVVDDKLAEELEVRSGQVVMMFEVDQAMPNGQSDQMNMEFKGKGNFDLKAVDLSGQVHLISGKQDLNIKMIMAAPTQGEAPMPQMFGGAKEELQYFHQSTGVSSSFSANVTFNGNAPDEKYYVDGNPVTAEAYTTERSKFANSMMAFGAQSGNEQQQDSSHSEPTPRPRPDFPPTSSEPIPTPTPGPVSPSPRPQPGPRPPVGEQKWACVVQEYSKNEIFIGYGPVEFVARSKANQACQASGLSVSCSSMLKCEEQEKNSQAWFCETKNYNSGQIFNGVGASKTEAGYFARKSCLVNSGTSPQSCAEVRDSNCVHQ